MEEAGAPVQVIAVGKKARDYFVRTRQDVIAEFIGIGDTTTLDAVRPIADIAIDDFASGKVDAVYVVYSRFINTLVQRPEFMQILLVEPPPAHEGYADYIFEPTSRRAQRAIAALRRGSALPGDPGGDRSEHSARMVAMRSASDNAKEIQQELTLSTTRRVRRRSPERFPRSRPAPMRWPASSRETGGTMTDVQTQPDATTVATDVVSANGNKPGGATGTILQITGPVVDVQFPADMLPEIYNALEVTRMTAASSPWRRSRTSAMTRCALSR